MPYGTIPRKVEKPTLWMENRPGRHHVDQPPPLMLPTILVHYYCVLPGKNIENFIMKHNDMIESGYSQGDIAARDMYLTIFPNNMIFLRIFWKKMCNRKDHIRIDDMYKNVSSTRMSPFHFVFFISNWMNFPPIYC